jgi:hypothetical protein
MGVMAPACLLLAGCATKSVSDAGATFHYQWWLPIGILLGCLVFVPIGWFVRTQSDRIGWGLLIVGVLGLLIAPMLFFERTHVNDQGVDVHSGIYGMTANLNVNFDSVNSIRVAQEETGGRRSRQIEVLYFDMKGGESARFPLNNDVKIEAGKEIVARAAKRGIPVVGLGFR